MAHSIDPAWSMTFCTTLLLTMPFTYPECPGSIFICTTTFQILFLPRTPEASSWAKGLSSQITSAIMITTAPGVGESEYV